MKLIDKKFLFLCLAIPLLAITSCGGGGDDEEETVNTPAEQQEETSTNEFAGKTFEYAASSQKLIFLSDTRVNYFFSGEDHVVSYTVDREKNLLSLGGGVIVLRYEWRGVNLVMKSKEDDGSFSDYGVWINAADSTNVADSNATGAPTVEWTYTSESPMLTVRPGTTSVTINGVEGGKSLYIVAANKGGTKIEESDRRALSVTGATSEVSAGPQGGNIIIAGRKLFEEQIIDINSFATFKKWSPTSSARAVARSAVKEWSVGDTKTLHINVGELGGNSYEEKQATLRAKGEHCYVWVLDDYYADSADGVNVNTTVAETFANKFDTIYNLVREAFGKESEYLRVLSKDTSKNKYTYDPDVAIGELSDTGSMVNLVLFDIEGDGESGDINGMTAGYFHSKDFYYCEDTIDASSTGQESLGIDIYNQSNVGKYLYLDSAIANSKPRDAYSTIAHEFNHMVTAGMKEIGVKAQVSTSYNEMLAMVCEDMMQEKLELEDSESPKNRTSGFNTGYYTAGITEWNKDGKELQCYANSYTFGAWLFRQYGGAALSKEMEENAYVDNESIVSAVNTVNSTSYSFEDLLGQFAQAITGSDTYTHKKDATTTVTYDGYNFPMKAYDIFSSTYGGGPTTFGFGDSGELAAYNGLRILKGTVDEGATSVTITLSNDSGTPSASELFYVIVK